MIAPASRKLGKYEILRKLGRGGMADVYLAQDTEANRTVALKLIEHCGDADSRDAIEAERRGAELQARLAAVESHVVGVFEYGDVETFFFVAMEYIDGQDLAELMRHGPLECEFAADAAIAVAETLENAHNFQTTIGGKNFRGIVHGDIKPKNVRIDAHGEVRVLDFGIAKALSLSRRLTRNEFGSVPYASPERLDTGDVNAQSDLWSLAVMLYEMLTGMTPYHAESTERLERMIRSRIPPPPAPDPCPDPLRRILMKALANDPAVRYHTARDFANDLILFRTGGPIVAPSAAPIAASSTATRGAPAADPDATRRTARHVPDPSSGRLFGQSSSDATRRTTPPAPAPSKQAWPKPGSKPTLRSRLFRNVTRVVAALAVGCVLYGGSSIFSWFRLHDAGQGLEREIKSEQLTDPDQIWTKWTELSKTAPSSSALWGVRGLVDRRFLDAANIVIARYRNDTQAVYEKDWERAQTLLSHALAVNPDDETARGEYRLSEGHIARIEGLRHRDAGQLTLAAEKFNQAQQLLPQSPDPQLGLALVDIYGLKDVDKADAALQQAARFGYQLGNREKLELADGYRDRGDRLRLDAINIQGLPQERDQISRAAGDYQHALNLYQSVVPYGNSNVQIKRVQASLESANTRLQEIH
ncbi:MAG: protein kinase [Bryobacteraceae bacterium]|jgi:serine/threonine protein kinase